MKLNQDCIRDVLLAIEKLGTPDTRLFLDDLSNSEFCEKYGINDLGYTVSKLIEAGFINASPINVQGGKGFIIRSITWNGHDFLDNIRDKTVWDKTKEKASKVGGASIPILSAIAKEMIFKKLGLN